MRNVSSLFAFLVLALFVSQANGTIAVQGVEYTQTGTTETIVASFGPASTAPSGVSLSTYQNLVEVTVTGVGESSSTRLNDAFYVFTDVNHNLTAPTHGNHYQLAFDTSPIVGGPTPSQATPSSQYATRAIAFDVDASADVSLIDDYLPAYRANHEYNLVLDVGAAASLLYFGVANGIYADNSGAYTISVTQLEAVPEPSSLIVWSLIGLSFAGIGWRRRRKAA